MAEFQITFDDQLYLVRVEEFRKDSRKKTVFSNFGNDEFELDLFKINDDSLEPVSVLSLSEEIQTELAELLRSILPQYKTFVPNPFFDEVIIFYGNPVFTSQEKLKRINCDTCHLSDLYQKREKSNKTQYINDVQAKLLSKPHPGWPFEGNLMIQITISDTISRLRDVDLDNLIKSIIDSLKGVVFKDDGQVVALCADKTPVLNVMAYVVAIRKMGPDEKPKFQEFLFSGDRFAWEDERTRGEEEGKFSRMIAF